MMMWLLLATGFMGGLTVVFQVRWLYRCFRTPPSIEVFYSPKGGCKEAVVRELKRARREILVQAYSFTCKEIAQGLIEAKGRGVHIEILLDRSNEQETFTELNFLKDHGLTPLIDAHHAIAHNKIMLIDKRTIITGSFNFTHQAEHANAENLLVIKGHPELIKRYDAQFDLHKAHCQAAGTAKPETQHNQHQRRAA